MPFHLDVKPSGHYIDTDLKEFSKALENLINVACQVNRVEIHNLKFKLGRLYDFSTPLTMDILIKNRIPIFDAIIYLSLSSNEKELVRWEVDENRPSYDEGQITFSCLFIYFMLMTRNKAFPDRSETIPNFLMKFMHKPMNIDEIKRCLSENNLNMFNHLWIKGVEIKKLSSAIKNRFKQGIAGMRLFSAIHDNEPDLVVDSNTRVLLDRINELVESGPYWEMHTMFQTNYLSSQAINANLNNLLLEIYSDGKLKELVNNRSIFKYPVYSARALQYKTWGDAFFSEYKTKVVFD